MGDDDFWGENNTSDVSIGTANHIEIITGSHITEQLTFEFQGSGPTSGIFPRKYDSVSTHNQING